MDKKKIKNRENIVKVDYGDVQLFELAFSSLLLKVCVNKYIFVALVVLLL